MNVLIIDDSELIIMAAKRMLQNTRFKLESLCIKHSVLGLSKAIEEAKPEIILLDVKLGMYKGDRFVPFIRKRTNAIILFYSGQPDQELSDLVTITRADGFIRKAGDKPLDKQIEWALVKYGKSKDSVDGKLEGTNGNRVS